MLGNKDRAFFSNDCESLHHSLKSLLMASGSGVGIALLLLPRALA